MAATSRRWAIGPFFVTSERLFVGHAGLPLVAELRYDGSLVRVLTWELDPSWRHLEPTASLLVRDAELVVASPDWRSDRGHPMGTDRHPVLWEQLSDEDRVARQHALRGWSPAISDDEVLELDTDLEEADLPMEGGVGVEPTTPVWVLEGATVTPIDLGGQVWSTVAIDGRLVAEVWSPTDPLEGIVWF